MKLWTRRNWILASMWRRLFLAFAAVSTAAFILAAAYALAAQAP